MVVVEIGEGRFVCTEVAAVWEYGAGETALQRQSEGSEAKFLGIVWGFGWSKSDCWSPLSSGAGLGNLQ